MTETLSCFTNSSAKRIAKDRNYLVTPSADLAYTRRFGKLEIRVCTPAELQP